MIQQYGYRKVCDPNFVSKLGFILVLPLQLAFIEFRISIVSSNNLYCWFDYLFVDKNITLAEDLPSKTKIVRWLKLLVVRLPEYIALIILILCKQKTEICKHLHDTRKKIQVPSCHEYLDTYLMLQGELVKHINV